MKGRKQLAKQSCSQNEVGLSQLKAGKEGAPIPPNPTLLFAGILDCVTVCATWLQTYGPEPASLCDGIAERKKSCDETGPRLYIFGVCSNLTKELGEREVLSD